MMGYQLGGQVGCKNGYMCVLEVKWASGFNKSPSNVGSDPYITGSKAGLNHLKI